MPTHQSPINKANSSKQTKSWRSCEDFASKPLHLQKLFEDDTKRADKYRCHAADMILDYSKNLVDDSILNALFDLARSSGLESKRDALFAGEIVNHSESRAAMHSALRDADCTVHLDGSAIAPLIQAEKLRMYDFAKKVRDGRYLGFAGRSIERIVNIGIGGSDLGPKMLCTALAEWAHPDLSFDFIANVDGACIKQLLLNCSPDRTLFIIQSKSFSTQETLLNSATVLAWYRSLGIAEHDIAKQWVAVTAHEDKLDKLGIQPATVLKFWDWVGGRYSVWSTIGLPIVLCCGEDCFEALLSGAKQMDKHFIETKLESNMPTILALLGIWYINFLGASSHALLPYCERLSLLPTYIQQLDMESNGKSVTQNGAFINDKATAPIIWGQTGSSAQHSFFQLLHQSNRLIPVDFIAAAVDDFSIDQHHQLLLANMLAQAATLMHGTAMPMEHDEADKAILPHQYVAGNRPSNILMLNAISPQQLGALLALYEHKVFVQGVIWGINSFDQWGVALAKSAVDGMLGNASAATEHQYDWDSSTLYWRQSLL